MAYDNVKEVDCLDVSKEGTEAWDAACKRYLANSELHYILACVDCFLLLSFVNILLHILTFSPGKESDEDICKTTVMTGGRQ